MLDDWQYLRFLRGTCLTDVTGGAELKSHRLRHNLRLMSLAFCDSETASDHRESVFRKTDYIEKGGNTMAVRLNEDAEMVKTIREGLKRTGGYCPCRLERTPENKCVCKEFREQIADPQFHGYCHCMLYYKE